jgi:type II secretory pathway predicted ATPase ExeA
MRVDVRQPDGCTQPLRHAGDSAPQPHRPLLTAIQSARLAGPWLARCGVSGSGQTVTRRRRPPQRQADHRGRVSQALAVDTPRLTLGTLITALFSDRATAQPLRLPTQSEPRAREVRDLVHTGKRPGGLGVDEAPALTRHPLTGRTRFLAGVDDGDGTRSLGRAGHPQRGNDCRRPTRADLGDRPAIVPVDGLAGSPRASLQGLFHVWTAGKSEPERLLTPEAIALCASTLRTPLHMPRHLTLARAGG